MSEHERSKVEDFGMILKKNPPSTCGYAALVPSWPTYFNDTESDCTAAAVAHAVELFTRVAQGTTAEVQPSDVQDFYSRCSGYRPGVAATDLGAMVAVTLYEWMHGGIGGHRIPGFAKVPSVQVQVEQACWTFGGLIVVVNLPNSAKGQVSWTVTDPNLQGAAAPGSWGSHCALLAGYNECGPIFVSWGRVVQGTWEWWAAYRSSAWACASPDWIGPLGVAPSGYTLDEILTTLRGYTDMDGGAFMGLEAAIVETADEVWAALLAAPSTEPLNHLGGALGRDPNAPN